MLNVFKTFVFLAILSALFIVTGNLIGGKIGATIALFIALTINLPRIFRQRKKAVSPP